MFSGFRFLFCLLLLATAVSTSGCFFRKQPLRTLQIGPLEPQLPAAPDPLPPPDFEFPPVQASAAIVFAGSDLPPGPPPRTEPRRVRRTSASSAVTKPEIDEAGEEPIELPQLGEVLSEQQMRDYVQATEASLEHAKRIMSTVGRRPLDSRQADVLGQVQGFIRQAEAAQNRDIPLARNLAQRAEILAKDLLNSLK